MCFSQKDEERNEQGDGYQSQSTQDFNLSGNNKKIGTIERLEFSKFKTVIAPVEIEKDEES